MKPDILFSLDGVKAKIVDGAPKIYMGIIKEGETIRKIIDVFNTGDSDLIDAFFMSDNKNIKIIDAPKSVHAKAHEKLTVELKYEKGEKTDVVLSINVKGKYREIYG